MCASVITRDGMDSETLANTGVYAGALTVEKKLEQWVGENEK